jgi:hypothetical protein
MTRPDDIDGLVELMSEAAQAFFGDMQRYVELMAHAIDFDHLLTLARGEMGPPAAEA